MGISSPGRGPSPPMLTDRTAACPHPPRMSRTRGRRPEASPSADEPRVRSPPIRWPVPPRVASEPSPLSATEPSMKPWDSDGAPYVSTGELPSAQQVRDSLEEAYLRFRTETAGER